MTLLSNAVVALGVVVSSMLVASPSLPDEAEQPLQDCHIPFSELRSRAPSCTVETPLRGRRCERALKSEFPEVVAVYIPRPSKEARLCSGTLIASKWVLSAAHCFVNDTRAADLDSLKLLPDEQVRPVIWASKAKLPDAERIRRGTHILVHPHYSGYSLTDPVGQSYQNDLAVIELDAPYPDSVVPAELATAEAWKKESTIAGYGYSNASNGTMGKLELTWPSLLEFVGTEMRFATKDQFGNRSAFCRGDSGGPVFAGRVRGCMPTDEEPERRPRLIEGTISYIQRLGEPPEHARSEEEVQAERCRTADYDVVQNITAPEQRAWICTATTHEAGGCASKQ